MAYIPWWNRTGPITLGERFGLNEISTRAKPLSPTKSYAQKPYNWEEGNWWDLEDESVGGTKILEDFEITEEMRRRPNAAGGRIGYKEAGPVKPVLYKIIQRGHPEEGRWAYKRSDNPIMYFDTKKEAEYAKKISKILQYESMERPTTGVFQKKVKNLLDEGLTKKQVAKELKVNYKVVDRAIKEGNIKWKFEPYINVPKNLNYVKKNYGSLSRETMAKKLFPNEPLSTSLSRIGKISQKLFDTGELKPIEGPTKEHAKKHGYYKNPEHEIVAKVKKAKRDAVKARSVESIETSYSGTKKTQLSHMDDIYSQFTTGETLGYAPAKINQEFLKEYDNKMKSLYKKRDRLLKEKPKDLIKQLEQINKTGARLAGETDGYKSFKFIDPYTLKPYQFGVNAAKTIDPLGILEGKTIQETSIPADPTVKRSRQILDLSPVDRYFFEKNRKSVLASQKKVNPNDIIKKVTDGIKILPSKEIEKIGEVIGCGRKKAEGGRIGFGVGSGSMLACIDAKFEKDPKGFFKKTAGMASAGLDKLWKYAAPYWFPSVIAATGRLEAFKDPTDPQMWWDIMLASDAVKRWGLDKVTLSQLKNASWLKKADIIGKLLLKFPGDKILTKAAKVAKPLIVATETLQGYKGVSNELDLVKEFASKNNIPYEKARIAYFASDASMKPRWEGDKSFRAYVFPKIFGGDQLFLTAARLRNNAEVQNMGTEIFNYIKENKQELVKEEYKQETVKKELPSMPKREDYGIIEKEPLKYAAVDSYSMGGIASLIK